MSTYTKDNYISALDGLRGLMAFWVFYGHFQLFCIGTEPALGSPAIAVDVFMLLSGFLMYYQWEKRWSTELSYGIQTKIFYLRRIFRIAPLYFLLLVIVYIFTDYYHDIQVELNSFVFQDWASDASSGPLANGERSLLVDEITHFTFIFAFLPNYVETNILPDWSIGLEMQFYLFLPLIILMIRKMGWFSMTVIILALTYINSKLFGVYGTEGLLAHFDQPGFLGFKLYIFLAGMLIGGAYLNKKSSFWMIFLAIGIIFYATTIQFKAFFVLILFILFYDFDKNPARIPGILIKMLNWMGSPFGKFLGNSSYSIYLLHNLVLFPVLVFLHGTDWFSSLSNIAKMGFAAVIVFPIAYGISYLLFSFIEVPGINYGRKIVKKQQAKALAKIQNVADVEA